MSHVFLINPDAKKIVRVEHLNGTSSKLDSAKWEELNIEAEQKGYRAELCTSPLVSLEVIHPDAPVYHDIVFSDSIRVTEAGALTFDRFDPVLNSHHNSIYAPGQWIYCGTGNVTLADRDGGLV